MKKFHKRAAVFLTAATLAGLPAGAAQTGRTGGGRDRPCH